MSPTFLIVHCCKSDPTWPYLYEPVVSTLQLGVKRAASGWKVETLLLQEIQSAASMPRALIKLTHPDVVVCVGPLGCPSMPWSYLHDRGVLTVYYQTEPLHTCASIPVNEIWDFSWHNIETCAKTALNGCHDRPAVTTERCGEGYCMECMGFPLGSPTWTWPDSQRACLSLPIPTHTGLCKRKVAMRYVPLGALNESFAPPFAHQQESVRSLTFVGMSRYRDGKCWDQLRQQLPEGSNLALTDNVWSHDAFQRVLNSPSIFLNVHKSVVKGSHHWNASCGDHHNPVTFRFAKLLNSGALLISEKCNQRDELEFADLVNFTRFSNLGHKFARLQRLTRAQRHELAVRRRNTFAERFAPEKVFLRAGITELLHRRSADDSQTVRPLPIDNHDGYQLEPLQ